MSLRRGSSQRLPFGSLSIVGRSSSSTVPCGTVDCFRARPTVILPTPSSAAISRSRPQRVLRNRRRGAQAGVHPRRRY